MKAKQLWFSKPFALEIREPSLGPLTTGTVLVRSRVSAISAGSELLVYRGQLPEGLALDTGITSLKNNNTAYPLQYGYATVGAIEKVADKKDESLIGKRVFAFQPHSSHFISNVNDLIMVPDDITPTSAVFLANMETAVNLVLDGNPRLGEKVVVIGHGIVGLLLISVLNRFPLAGIYGLDTVVKRRSVATQTGLNQVFDPKSENDINTLQSRLNTDGSGSGADLVYEVSGTPDTINLALELCGLDSRIVVGSWYGTRTAELQLGGTIHRNRIRLISSQVSNIAPKFTGRWDRQRRFDTAWTMLRQIKPEKFISHSIKFENAAEAYQLLDKTPEDCLQVILTHEN